MGFAIIKFVVESFGEINGWNYGQLAFLYGLSVISHALSMIFFVQGWFMGYYVIEGDFDRYLTRPLGVLYQFFFTNINIFGVTDLIPGILVFIYGCVKCEVTVNLLFILQVVVLRLFAGASIFCWGALPFTLAVPWTSGSTRRRSWTKQRCIRCPCTPRACSSF